MSEAIFKKGKIGNLAIKNRVFLTPMGTCAAPDGGFTETAIRYYEERAKGGAGLIFTGINMCTTKYEGRTGNELSSVDHVERLGMMIERCQNYGAKVVIQIGPGYGRIGLSEGQPISASDCESFWVPGLKCRPLTVEEIHDLTQKMGKSAQLAQQAGADAVEIHAYGGYLLDQFMSSQWNTRQDEYGGSFENRMRFTTEIIQETQKVCGSNFPIIVKYSAIHTASGGRELAEGIEMAKHFEKLGVTALHVDVGSYESWWDSITTVYNEPAFGIDVAAAVKSEVSIPVLGNGKMNDPEMASDAVESGKVDFVGLGHQLIADPDWVNKVKEGRTYDIIPCIGCNECMHSELNGTHYHCSVNPLTCAEDLYQLTPATEKHSVLIIGGGPGGMMAALAAAQRGFDVELWEKSNRLGGNLWAAGLPPHKEDVLKLIRYMETQLHKHNVKIRLMKEATADTVLEGRYDKVILATGATSVTPPISGVEHAVLSTEILEKRKAAKGHVVVIGGGLVGCETAMMAAEQAESVTIIEVLDDIMKLADHCIINSMHLRKLLADGNVTIKTSSKVKSIAKDSLVYTDDDGEHTIPCDMAVLAAGYKSNNQLEEELEGKVDDLTVIGDAAHPRKIMTAVHEGYHTIRTME